MNINIRAAFRLKNNNYLEDKEYKAIYWEYLDYAERCRCSNEFNENDKWIFNKRDELEQKLNEIKQKYTT